MSLDPDDVARWYDSGDRAAGERVARHLLTVVQLPASFTRVLGDARARELEQDVRLKLLDQDKRILIGARKPAAVISHVLRNCALDELRRRRSRGDLGFSAVSLDDSVKLPAVPAADIDTALDASTAVCLVGCLTLDSRLAVLLTYFPRRISISDWAALLQRHADPPTRPDHPADSDEASQLIWPARGPELTADRRRRLDRMRVVLKRAYAKLADALGAR